MQIEHALESIIPEYEKVNRVLSLNLIDSWWRECASHSRGARRVLELGCGTGCLSRLITSEMHVCTDPSMLMLLASRSQTQGKKVYIQCIAESLPFRDNTFDLVISSFAFRDFVNKRQALVEGFRVLRSGGRVVIAEIAKTNPVSAKVIYWYFKFALSILSRVGACRPENHSRWRILPETYRAFGYIKEYEDMMRDAGFKTVEHRAMSGGFALLLTGVKP